MVNLNQLVWYGMNLKKKNNKNFEIKKIIRKLEIPSLKKDTLKFLNWFSNYNIVPKGMALKLVLLGGKPVGLLEEKFYQNFDLKFKENSIKLTSEQKKALDQINLSNIYPISMTSVKIQKIAQDILVNKQLLICLIL